jgi:hypothetical protein
MNNIYEVRGDKFDFEITPTEFGINSADLWWLADFTIKCTNGIIYLMSDKNFGKNKGIRVKKVDFYETVFNMFYAPSENDMRKMSINDIRVAVNTYPSSIRQLYLDYYNAKRFAEQD